MVFAFTFLRFVKISSLNSPGNGGVGGSTPRPEMESCHLHDMHRNKFNNERPMRATLGDPYKEAWDSWPEKVWKSDNDSVVLVQSHIQQEKKESTQGLFDCVWSNVRSLMSGHRQETPAVEVKEEDQETVSEPINRPTFSTGELPQNSIVDISAFNHPDQTAFIEAVNKPPSGYEDELGTKRVMPFKCPFALMQKRD